jgi:regulator of sirC expression with transglutaminase-like and TPR domain
LLEGLRSHDGWAAQPQRALDPSPDVSAEASGRGAPLPGPARRTAAIEALFGDPSPAVWDGVRSELDRLGGAARPLLRRTARDGAPRARSRARSLLLGLERERATRRLIGYALRREVDLERGFFLLARFADPRADLRKGIAALDAMGAEVLQRTESLPPGPERSLLLCEHLGRELGFGGDDEDYHHPDNVHLHRVIERRRGLPLSLCALYLFVARRARISAAAVALPGHVVLRLHLPGRNLLVDPFHRGALVSERDCLQYLARHSLPFHPAWFADAEDSALLERQVLNLRAGYERSGLAREVRQLERVRAALQARRAATIEEAAT